MNQQHYPLDPVIRAKYDYRDGASIDQNPYPKGTHSHNLWQKQMDKLYNEEFFHECSANRTAQH
jgi:hypothetical protein